MNPSVCPACPISDVCILQEFEAYYRSRYGMIDLTSEAILRKHSVWSDKCQSVKAPTQQASNIIYKSNYN